MSTEVMQIADGYLLQAETAKASGDPAFKASVATQARAYAEAQEANLEPWMRDQLNGVADYLGVGGYSKASPKQDATLAGNIFSQRTADDVGEHASALFDKLSAIVPKVLGPLIKSAAKGLWVYVAGAGLVLTVYIVGRKKRWF